MTFTIDLLGRRVVAPEEGEKLQQEREQQAAAAAAAAAGKGAKPGFAVPELPDEVKVSCGVGPCPPWLCCCALRGVVAELPCRLEWIRRWGVGWG